MFSMLVQCIMSMVGAKS